jgi:hypothetical protein
MNDKSIVAMVTFKVGAPGVYLARSKRKLSIGTASFHLTRQITSSNNDEKEEEEEESLFFRLLLLFGSLALHFAT